MIVSSNDVIEETGWVVFADVFGFKALVEAQRTPRNIVNRLFDCYKKVNTLLKQEAPLTRMFNFSDSLFLFYPVTGTTRKKSLETCIAVTQRVMSKFTENELPLRGGIAYGKVAFSGNLLAGQPILKAYSYEQTLPAPLLLLPAKEITLTPTSIRLHPWLKGFRTIELKDNKSARAKLFAPEPIEGFSDLCKRLFHKYSIHGPWELAKPWLDACLYIERYLEDTKEDQQ